MEYSIDFSRVEIDNFKNHKNGTYSATINMFNDGFKCEAQINPQTKEWWLATAEKAPSLKDTILSFDFDF